MSLDWYPVFLALETTPGLEDYAAEMVLRCLGSGMLRVFVNIDSALLSGYVILRFLAEDLVKDSTPKPLKETVELCRSGRVPCISAAYMCVEEVTLDSELCGDLRRDWRAEDLRKNEESRRMEKRRPWGARSGPDDRPKGRGHSRGNNGSDPTQAENKFLRTAQSMVENSHVRLSTALGLAYPSISRYSFRATLNNPQHLVPFPFLSTTYIEKALGEPTSEWLDSKEVESIQNWETLCDAASQRTGPSEHKLGRLWKVDLKNAEVEVVLQLLSVPPSPRIRSINPVDETSPYSGHSPRPEFPVTIRLILGIRVPGIAPAPGRPGRTALSPVTANLLVSVMPGLSPFAPQTPHPLVLLDPCSGTGSIPHAISAVSNRDRHRTLVLCGDILAHNVKSAITDMGQWDTALDGIIWAAEEVPPGIRQGVIDGIVAGDFKFSAKMIYLNDHPTPRSSVGASRVYS
ncbi:hypothetical protein FRC04_007313 [Tulasnella sp. 424]|nr:hypothetical protein FRC04_007313 [Tulasnella sp. 424]